MGKRFSLLEYGNCSDPCGNVEATFGKSQLKAYLESVFCTSKKYYNFITPYFIIRLLLHYLSSGCLQEVRNKEKFQTLSSKSSCGRLQEVVACKRFQI